MAIRMSGLISGLDTESIIKELMSAQSQKKVKIENKQTKLTWTQEKWKDLNTKIYALYTGSLSTMKLEGSYQTKKVTSSNEGAVTATAGSSAATGTHKIKVNALASEQYVTGAKLASDVTSSTKLVDLGGMAAGTVISFASKSGKANTLEVTADTTIKDFLSAAQGAGLTASFDSTQKRLFISSGESGEGNGFTITASDMGSGTIDNSQQIDALLDQYNLTNSEMGTISDAHHFMELSNNQVGTTLSNLTSAQSAYQSYQEYYDALSEDDKKVEADNLASYKTDYETAQEEYTQALKDRNAQAEVNKGIFTNILENYETDPTKLEQGKQVIEQYVSGASADGSANSSLAALGLQAVTGEKVDGGADGFSVKAASDANITLDGAEMISTSNSMTVNGITYNLTDVTTKEETISVANDTESAYKVVKDFLKQYNELLKEMNEAYYADSARGYDPLTDEEKEAMTDDQVEKWEKKIKDSLLRRDNSLDGLMSSMKISLMGSIEVDGKKYSLSSYGISTSTDWTEKGLLHIYGDKEDSTYADKDDKLKAALEKDPDTVIKVLTGIANNLATTMQDKMKATSLSSALTFYNDKEMKKQNESYDKEISRWETKLAEMEERYYKQFTAMESAMSKLNGQSSQLAGLFGSAQ